LRRLSRRLEVCGNWKKLAESRSLMEKPSTYPCVLL
jgi:hypothetical protein